MIRDSEKNIHYKFISSQRLNIVRKEHWELLDQLSDQADFKGWGIA